MKTLDHKILAKKFIENMKGICEKKKKAFSLGCISPDYNVFTYIKGSLKHTMLHGHNYLNSKKSVFKMIDKLKDKKEWSTFDFFKLGKLIHYVTDAFTYTHNDMFKGNIQQHVVYEEKLHDSVEYLWNDENNKFKEEIESDNIYNYYEKMHEKYEKSLPGFTTDVMYIKEVCTFFIDTLLEKYIKAEVEPGIKEVAV